MRRMVKAVWKDGKMLFKNGKPVFLQDGQSVENCDCCGCPENQCCNNVLRCYSHEDYERAKKVQDFIVEVFDVQNIASSVVTSSESFFDGLSYSSEEFTGNFELNGLSALNGTYNATLAPYKCHNLSYWNPSSTASYQTLDECKLDKGSKLVPLDINPECTDYDSQEFCFERQYCLWKVYIPQVPITGTWSFSVLAKSESDTFVISDYWAEYSISGKASFLAAHKDSVNGIFPVYNTLSISAIATPISFGGYYRRYTNGSWELEKRDYVPLTYYINDSFSRRLEYSNSSTCSFYGGSRNWLPNRSFLNYSDVDIYDPSKIWPVEAEYGDYTRLTPQGTVTFGVPMDYCNTPREFEEGEPIYHNGFSYSNSSSSEDGSSCSHTLYFTGIYGGSRGRIILAE